MSDFDQIIFGNKKFNDLLKELHNRNVKKEQEFAGLVSQLRGLIANVTDALTIAPLIGDYMNLSVKNDDNFIKFIAVIQKAMDRGSDTGDFTFTEDEKAKLLEEADKLTQDLLKNGNKGLA